MQHVLQVSPGPVLGELPLAGLDLEHFFDCHNPPVLSVIKLMVLDVPDIFFFKFLDSELARHQHDASQVPSCDGLRIVHSQTYQLSKDWLL